MVMASMASASLRFRLRRIVQIIANVRRIMNATPPAAPPAMAGVLFLGEGVGEVVAEAAGSIEMIVVVGLFVALGDDGGVGDDTWEFVVCEVMGEVILGVDED